MTITIAMAPVAAVSGITAACAAVPCIANACMWVAIVTDIPSLTTEQRPTSTCLAAGVDMITTTTVQCAAQAYSFPCPDAVNALLLS